MITTLDTQSWSLEILTGNGQLAIVSDGGSPPADTFYLVSNVRADNTFAILKSDDFGYHWAQIAEYSFSSESPARDPEAFDPAICVDVNGVLHIIGSQPSATGNGFDVLHFAYHTAGSPPSLSGPDILIVSERVASDYDLVALSDGTVGFAVSVINPVYPALGVSPVTSYSGNTLLYGILDSGNYTVVANSPFRTGNTFGSVTLFSPDGVAAEVYYNSHSKPIDFLDFTVTVFCFHEPSATTSELTQFTCRWVDDRLTVLGDGINRYLSQGFYTYKAHYGLTGNLLLGATPDSVNWFFQPYLGTPAKSFTQPTLSLTNSTLTLNYVVRNMTNSSVAGPLKIASIDPTNLNLIDVPGVYNVLNFTWLRGTKNIVDDASVWLVVGELDASNFASPPSNNIPTFVSAHDVPPIAILEPSSENVNRNQFYTFDASQSSNANLDTLHFTWELIGIGSPPSVVDQNWLLPNGNKATLFVPDSVGPDALEFDVVVTVTALIIVHEVHNILAAGSPPQYIVQVTNHAIFFEDLGVAYGAGSSKAGVQFQSVASPADLSETGQYYSDGTGNYYFYKDDVSAPVAISYATNDEPTDQAFSDVSVAFNPAPQVSFNPPVQSVGSPATWELLNQPRNSVISVPVQVIAGLSSDVITYFWEQVDGTSVVIVQNNQQTLTFKSNGVDIHGDTVTFSLTVDDQVNAAVVVFLTVTIVPYFELLASPPVDDTQYLARAFWGGGGSPAIIGDIVDRNMDAGWGMLIVSQYLTDMTAIKRSVTLGGDNRVLYIGALDVLVLGDSETGPSSNEIMMRRLFPPTAEPNPVVRPLWIDAIHTEADFTACLDNSMKLYQFTSAPLVNTDNPAAVINLASFTTFQFNKVFCTATYNNRRVFVLSGPDGLVLMQVDNATFTVTGFFEISQNNSLLYGANNVQWVRVQNVESIHQGQVLVGTIDANGATYETFIDLFHHQITGLWDKTKLKNPTVDTGEFMFQPSDQYFGRLTAPILGNPTNDNEGNVFLSWTQIRSDLVLSYTIEVSIDGGNTYQILKVINFGSTLQYEFLGEIGLTYYIRMFSYNLDGNSPLSNVVVVVDGPVASPVLGPAIANSQGAEYTVTLNWTFESVAPISFFTIYQSVNGGNYLPIGTVSASTFTFTTPLLAGQQAYSYEVSAFVPSQNQNTQNSNAVGATIGGGFGFDFGQNYGL